MLRGDLGLLMLLYRNICTDNASPPLPLPGCLIFLFTVILLLWELLLSSPDTFFSILEGLAYLFISNVAHISNFGVQFMGVGVYIHTNIHKC